MVYKPNYLNALVTIAITLTTTVALGIESRTIRGNTVLQFDGLKPYATCQFRCPKGIYVIKDVRFNLGLLNESKKVNRLELSCNENIHHAGESFAAGIARIAGVRGSGCYVDLFGQEGINIEDIFEDIFQ